MTPPTPSRFVILASLGVLGACFSQSSEPGLGGDPPGLEQAEGLAAEKHWQRCLEIWGAAAEAAFGEEPYPFDEAGKTALLEDLDKSENLVAKLRRKALLSEVEAGLLRQDVATLRAGVQAKRPTEMQAATCYQPRMLTPRQDALHSLAPRVELLEGLAAQEALQPEVVVRVLEQVRKDLAALTSGEGKSLDPTQQAQADDVQQRVEAALAAIDTRISSPQGAPGAMDAPVTEPPEGLAAERDWQRCTAVWGKAAEAAFGDEPYPFTAQGKEKLLERLDQSEELVRKLQAGGQLSEAEAGLLLQEVATLRAGVWDKRTSDQIHASCYEPMPYTPREDAFEALEPRLDLLEKLAAQETLEPLVVERVLARIQADLEVLTDGGSLPLDAQGNPWSAAARRVQAALDAIAAKQATPPQAPRPADPASIIPEASSGE